MTKTPLWRLTLATSIVLGGVFLSSVSCENTPPDDDAGPSGGTVEEDTVLPAPDTRFDKCTKISNCESDGAIVCTDDGRARTCAVDPTTGCLQLGAPISCETDGACTVGTCSPGTGCVTGPAPADTECDDGNACTLNDRCSPAGACAGTAKDCDDLDVCTTDSCDPATGCTYAATTEPCDDGNECTENDTCNGGVCMGTAGALDCNDDNVCTRDLCDLEFGCNYLNLSDRPCDDSLDTTRNDWCNDGTCVGETYTCTPLQCEATSEPNGSTCEVTFKTAGEACDDGDPATKDDQCDGAGACAGTNYDCTPTQCEETSVADGTSCNVTWKAEDTACDDGDPATRDDVCDGAGTCAGDAYSCTPGPCEASSTTNGTDCTVVVQDAGTACDDGDPATGDDTCDASGQCAGIPLQCVPAQCQATSTPNGAGCDVTWSDAGTTCDDGDPTTKDDQCDGTGGCAGTTYTCEPAQCEAASVPNGVDCTPVWKNAGAACDDTDPATRNDQCDGAGTCAGVPYSCIPAQCDASSTPNGSTCDVSPKAAGTACSDADPTTRDDECDGSGACIGTSYTCTPGQCDESSTPNGAGCTVVPMATGASCDDGDPATRNDACDGASGCAGTPFACAPGSCEASSVPNGTDCTVTPAGDGAPCDDGDPVTTNDTCDADGACAGEVIGCVPTQCESTSAPNGSDCTVTYKPAGTPCNDGDPTTQDDQCNGSGACNGDEYSCLANECEASSIPNGVDCTVVLAEAGTPCDDGNGNTVGDVCNATGHCAGAPVVCTPGLCEMASVPDGAGGCAVTPSPAGTPCDDGQLDTMSDECNGSGSCAGAMYVCPTSACVVANAYDGAGGCIPTFAVQGTSCNDGDPGTRFDQCDGSGGCAGQTYSCPSSACEVGAPNGVDCTITPKPSGTACDDQNSTTRDDQCDNDGSCEGTPYTCPATACAPSGTPNGDDCDYSYSPAGTPCDDGSLGTKNDVCNGSGTCAGTPYTCSPGVCASASVPNGTGCTDVPSAAGTPCNDGLNGTKDDVCNGNFTCAGTPYTCSAAMCESASVPNGTGCTPTYSPNGTGCNDGNNNTKNDQCNGSGSCVGTPYSCTPAVCQQSSTPNGTDCTIVNEPNGTVCGPGDACYAPMQCNNGTCVQGPQNSCGNNACDCGENPATCLADCPIIINDGNCGPGENACNSHNDCIKSIAHASDHSCNDIGCGGGIPGHCFCDPQCKNSNDCCPDKQEVCGCD